MISKHVLILFATSCFLAAAGMLGYGLFVYLIHDARSTLQTERIEYAKVQARSGGDTALLRQAESISELRTEFYSYLVPEEGIVDFLAFVESLGEGKGAEVTATGISIVEDAETADLVTLTLRADGSYSGVLEVLRLLELLPYRTEVLSSHMTGRGDAWQGEYVITVLKDRAI